MADEKKPEAKPVDTSWFSHPDPFVEVMWTAGTLLVVVYLINGVISTINSGEAGFLGMTFLQKYEAVLRRVFSYVEFVSVLLSLLAVFGIVYLFKKVSALRRDEAKLLYVESAEVAEDTNPQWTRVQNHIQSLNESNWRLAVLEADIMLDTLLDNMGLPGETMADKLKAVEKSDFRTIDNAWEAHKIRNQIAHEGETFSLSQHEAKRVVGLYQSVFEEFRII